MSQKTQVIAGHEITLDAGVRYYASRPMADGRKIFPVSITKFEAKHPTFVIGLFYDQANELINAFNNGATSFEGRVW